MTDLLDTRGRLRRLAIAVVLAAALGVLAQLAMSGIVHDPPTAARAWFAIATVGMVFVPSAFALNALLACVASRRARLPVARLVRR